MSVHSTGRNLSVCRCTATADIKGSPNSISMFLLFFCSLLWSAFRSGITVQTIPISVFYNSSSQTFIASKVYDESFDAFGYYHLNYNDSGWNFLDISMQTEISSINDHLQYSLSMGYLEGFISCQEITNFYTNFYSSMFANQKPNIRTIRFLENNYDWMTFMSDKLFESDNYWYSVKTTLIQLRGLFLGYLDGCGFTVADSRDWSSLNSPTFTHFLLLNSWRDLPNIAASVKHTARGTYFFKLLQDSSDLLFGHTTWDRYELLGPRIFKHYSFPLMRNGFAEHHYDVHMASAPGVLSSMDDLTVVNGYANLVILDTSLPMYKESFFLANTSTVLTWTRAYISYQLAKSGADWPKVFDRFRSGTYNGQWSVLDLKRFNPSVGPTSSGFFYLIEEALNHFQYKDETIRLIQESHFGSYNIPFFNETSKVTGSFEACLYDLNFCYETSPRAKLLRTYESNVEDISGMKWLLSYNSYQNDTASNGNPCETISCRADLYSDWRRRPYGSLDYKVSSVLNAKMKIGETPKIHVRLGPSFDQQPPFCWTSPFENTSHSGQPECFKFDWIIAQPQSINS